MPEYAAEVVDSEFLAWLRTVTELRWSSHVPRDFSARGVGGLDWATGTRWRGGLTESEIAWAERRYGLDFPPDYRRFLATLHTPDPEQVGAAYEGQTLVPTTGRLMYDWTGPSEPIRTALEWPVYGLVRSIEADDWWHSTWGERPETATERARVVRRLVEQGPPLIPVCGHRYLVGAPLGDGNPILSIYGSDVIVYADDLGSFLAHELALRPRHATRYEFADMLGLWWDVITG